MAPAPTRSLNTPEEWARFPVVSTRQPEAPLRAIVAFSKLVAVSKPSAISAAFPASMIALREIDKGFPVLSSSPVKATVMAAFLRRFNSARAFNAYSTITSPPFISLAPGP